MRPEVDQNMSDSPTTINLLPMGSLRFDPQNPRLPSSTKGGDEQAVLAYLLKDASLTELMGSIGEQGYFAGEPLLVCRSLIDKDAYIVIEGNRRFASVKLLNNPELAPTNKNSVQLISSDAKHKPIELPAVIYRNRESILTHLSYRHITGIKAWNPLQKARYLNQLREGILSQPVVPPVETQFRSLAKTIGTRSDYVEKLLVGHAVYNRVEDDNFFDIPRLNEDTFEFSVLTTAFTYASIKKFVGLDSDDDINLLNLKIPELEELIRWMFEKNTQNTTRLGESRNLKYLSKVVSNGDALKAFRSGMPLIDAKDLTEAPMEIFQGALIQARDRLVIARGTLHLISLPTISDDEILGEIILITRDMRRVVTSKIAEADDSGV